MVDLVLAGDRCRAVRAAQHQKRIQVYDSAFSAVIGSASLDAVGLDWQLGRLAVESS
jgi:hypothetical protein